VQHRLSLHSVFKVENKELLRKFDIQREKVAEADRPVILKGLFTHIKKKELMSRLIFGFSDDNKNFRKLFLRLPPKMLK
jgi:hypothetical protein